MKPARFEYVRAETVEAALDALSRHEGDVRILAGGQSLMPLMNMRMLRPAGIVDINTIRGLDGIRTDDDGVHIGAMTRYASIEFSEDLHVRVPLLHHAIRKVADRQVRNRGTLGGSLCHADPGAQMPLCALVLGACMTLRGPQGERFVPAEEFILGPYATAIGPTEMLIAVTYPDCTGHLATLVQQTRKHGDFPVVSVAASARPEADGTWRHWHIGACGLAPQAIRLRKAEALLEGNVPTPSLIEQAARLQDDGIDPPDDLRASAQYRLHLGPVYLRRAIESLLAQARRRSGEAM